MSADKSIFRVVAVLGNKQELVRHVDPTCFMELCAHITSFVSAIDGSVSKVLVQKQHLGEGLSEKPLSVVNICGKITHASSLYLHAPGCAPYVKKERNDFGLTDTVYTRFCNFHTGSNRTSTLFRAGTCSREISETISHVFVLDTLLDVLITNVVYNARLGRAVAACNTQIQQALANMNMGAVLQCMPAEECMFVHCFRLDLAQHALTQYVGLEEASVRVNICRTGVVNFFVGLPGGLPLCSSPEVRLQALCATLLQAILRAT